jgi:hypothetical protein
LDGEVIADYGSPITTERPEPFFRTIASAGPKRMWSAFTARYVVELLRADTVERRFVRNVEWFPDDTAARSLTSPPSPRVHALSDDGTGILWVLIRRPSRNWRPLSTGSSPVVQPAQLALARIDSLFEGVIEALDATSGAVLGSSTVSGSVLGFVGPRTLVDYAEDSAGTITLRFVRVELAASK